MGRVGVAILALLTHGCSVGVNPEVEARRDPVVAAAMDCDTARLRKLARTPPRSRDYGPLSWAIMKGCKEGVAILLEAGADPNGANEPWPPLQVAVARGETAVAELLLARGAGIHARSKQSSETAIFAAASSGKPEMLRFVLARGGDIRDRDSRGATPLHRAAHYPECARILLDAGAEVNARDIDGHTPLMFARGESVRLLLARGAELHAVSNEGRTALMMAAWMGQAVAVRALLDAGADVKARDHGGRTALSYAEQTRRSHRGFLPFVFRTLSAEYRAASEASFDAERQLAAATRP